MVVTWCPKIRDREVAGSNPVAPTTLCERNVWGWFRATSGASFLIGIGRNSCQGIGSGRFSFATVLHVFVGGNHIFRTKTVFLEICSGQMITAPIGPLAVAGTTGRNWEIPLAKRQYTTSHRRLFPAILRRTTASTSWCAESTPKVRRRGVPAESSTPS